MVIQAEINDRLLAVDWSLEFLECIEEYVQEIIKTRNINNKHSRRYKLCQKR